MHVAYLINHYPKVSHTFIKREIQALERQGIDVLRIGIRGWNDALADPTDEVERAKTLYVLRSGGRKLVYSAAQLLVTNPRKMLSAASLAWRLSRNADKAFFYFAIYFFEACLVAILLKQFSVAHIHAHFGTNSTTVAALAAELSGLPFSFTVHGPEEFERALAIALPEKIRLAKFVVAISSFCRSQLFRWIEHEQWHKVRIVHCGVDKAFYQEVAATQIQNNFVCVGRLCEEKGQLLLIEALRQVLDRGFSMSLVLAGDGVMRSAIEYAAEQSGVSKNLRITGWIGADQVRQEILSARALVLPSFAEGLPVVIMEAMALAKPVLTTFVAGIPELVLDKETGWLIPAGDLDSLIFALIECISTSDVALAKMGDVARLRVLARHDIDQESTKLARLFEGAIL